MFVVVFDFDCIGLDEMFGFGFGFVFYIVWFYVDKDVLCGGFIILKFFVVYFCSVYCGECFY